MAPIDGKALAATRFHAHESAAVLRFCAYRLQMILDDGARRKKAEARAAQIIAGEMILQELRHARKLTEVRLAKALGIGQDGANGPNGTASDVGKAPKRCRIQRTLLLLGRRSERRQQRLTRINRDGMRGRE